MPKSYANLKKRSEKNGEIEFDAEVPVDVLEEHMQEALGRFSANFEMQGFRKGKVPDHIVRERVGDMELIEHSADHAIRDAIREIAEDEQFSALGRPEVTLTKVAPKNPLAFKVRFALVPEVKLPDYKKIGRTIAERKDPVEVTEKDIDEAIERLQKMFAFQPGKNNESAPLPEINDAFVKQLGPFENVGAFRTELKKNLQKEKEENAKEAKRDEMIREIVKQTKMKVPALLVEQETQGLVESRDAELERAGLSIDEYLKQVNKTKTGLEAEERASIEEQIKMSLVFAEIRKHEEIVPDKKDVQMNIMELKRRYPDRDEHSLHEAAEAAVVQKKLFEILEGTALPEDLDKKA